MQTRRVAGVVFDAGDILYNATPWRRWLTSVLQQRGADVTFPQLVQRWESLLIDVYCGRAEYWDRFAALLDSYGIQGAEVDALALAAREKGKQVLIGRNPFDGVSETLDALRTAGLKLAVLSDSESTAEKVSKSLGKIGVAHYFDIVLTSFDLKHAKPEREAYQAAADALGLPLEACAFVGHDQDELCGARQCGMLVIAFNHADGVSADVFIERFAQLIEVVTGQT